MKIAFAPRKWLWIMYLNEDEWGDLKCLYKACQTAITMEYTAITDGGLFTNTVGGVPRLLGVEAYKV